MTQSGNNKLTLTCLLAAMQRMKCEPLPEGGNGIVFLPRSHPYWLLYTHEELCHMFDVSDVRVQGLIPVT